MTIVILTFVTFHPIALVHVASCTLFGCADRTGKIECINVVSWHFFWVVKTGGNNYN